MSYTHRSVLGMHRNFGLHLHCISFFGWKTEKDENISRKYSAPCLRVQRWGFTLARHVLWLCERLCFRKCTTLKCVLLCVCAVVSALCSQLILLNVLLQPPCVWSTTYADYCIFCKLIWDSGILHPILNRHNPNNRIDLKKLKNLRTAEQLECSLMCQSWRQSGVGLSKVLCLIAPRWSLYRMRSRVSKGIRLDGMMYRSTFQPGKSSPFLLRL